MKLPPRYALKFLRWFCRQDYLEEIEGNLIEIFEAEYEESPPRARANFTRHVIRHFRPAFIRQFKTKNTNSIDMLRHNLVITLRNYLKYKSTFFINIAGLSTGLATVFLVYLWVSDEWNVNRYNSKDDRLYQVMQNITNGDGTIQTGAGTVGVLAEALAIGIPEVEEAVAMVQPSWFNTPSRIVVGDKKLKVPFQFATPNFFKVFDVEVIRGDRQTALDKKYGVLVSETLAQELFNSSDAAIGKMVEWRWEETSHAYEITGVFRLPDNVTEHYDVLANYELFLERKDWLRDWGSSDPNTFVLLKSGTDVAAAERKIDEMIKKKDPHHEKALFLQLYADRYLYGHYEGGKVAGGRIEYVRLFIVIAIVILSIACINFMNLSTARATRRLKEIGVKKAIGARKGSLTVQFLTESMALSWLSAFVALILVWLLLPGFNTLTGKYITLNIDPGLWLAVIAIVTLTGFVSGSYPALYLSRFKTGEVLKGKLRTTFGELIARKGLVTFQYIMSFVLIVGVIVIYRQVNYVQATKLGYNREHIIHFDLEVEPNDDPQYFRPGGGWELHVESMMNELRKADGVTSVANFYHDVTGDHGGLGGVNWEPGDRDEKMGFNNLEVGFDFIPTLGVEIVQGRNYSREFANERAKIILNETAIKMMGLKDPVGYTIKVWGKDREIIGVVKDFHYESLYTQVKPCLIQLESGAPKIMVKLDGTRMQEGIEAVRRIYEQRNAGLAFEYRFLDDDYNALYASEQKVSTLSQIFAGLAILISCLGLYGLTAFTVERRMKEICVRKVFGASSVSIMRLLTSEFTWLVSLAMLIGVPVIWVLATSWLNAFAYRTSLAWWYFVAGGAVIFLITIVTVSLNMVKAAGVNPAVSLRSE
ncbi:MAG TPA: ABC transporter permease [Cyclobacteriaceae bacterium]|nr:ABC transporter permease [Cyclobacteriaceae bacterium]